MLINHQSVFRAVPILALVQVPFPFFLLLREAEVYKERPEPILLVLASLHHRWQVEAEMDHLDWVLKYPGRLDLPVRLVTDPFGLE